MRSEGEERTQFFSESHQKHRDRRLRAKTYHANTQYRAYRREESTKKRIHYVTQQQTLAFQNVQCKIQPSQMRKTLSHMHSRSPNDYKIRMMINTRQKENESPKSSCNPQAGLLYLPPQYNEPWQFLPWAAEIALFILNKKLLRISSPRTNVFISVFRISQAVHINGLGAAVFFLILQEQPGCNLGIAKVQRHLRSRRGLPRLHLEQLNHSTRKPYRGEQHLQSHPFRTNSVTS